MIFTQSIGLLCNSSKMSRRKMPKRKASDVGEVRSKRQKVCAIQATGPKEAGSDNPVSNLLPVIVLEKISDTVLNQYIRVQDSHDTSEIASETAFDAERASERQRTLRSHVHSYKRKASESGVQTRSKRKRLCFPSITNDTASENIVSNLIPTVLIEKLPERVLDRYVCVQDSQNTRVSHLSNDIVPRNIVGNLIPRVLIEQLPECVLNRYVCVQDWLNTGVNHLSNDIVSRNVVDNLIPVVVVNKMPESVLNKYICVQDSENTCVKNLCIAQNSTNSAKRARTGCTIDPVSTDKGRQPISTQRKNVNSVTVGDATSSQATQSALPIQRSNRVNNDNRRNNSNQNTRQCTYNLRSKKRATSEKMRALFDELVQAFNQIPERPPRVVPERASSAPVSNENQTSAQPSPNIIPSTSQPSTSQTSPNSQPSSSTTLPVSQPSPTGTLPSKKNKQCRYNLRSCRKRRSQEVCALLDEVIESFNQIGTPNCPKAPPLKVIKLW